ncbi:MAG: hypothetical protein LUQ59_11320 [Methanothrix sp.]|nr:hypothetical protein [Methanothrix sp.]
MSTIVFAPQLKELILEKVPSAPESVTAADLHRRHFSKTHLSSIKNALTMLHKFRAVERSIDQMGNWREYRYWRARQ